jgi:lipid-binding SYLF domain-containing protein
MRISGILRTTILALAVMVAGNVLAGWDPNAEGKAREAIAAFKKADPDLNAFFNKSYGYAVFPAVGKGGMGFGGAYGNGLVFEKERVIGSTSLAQLTFGFQLGGQVYREIIFFKDKSRLDDYRKGNFELGAQASAVAATLGASADADFNMGIAIFTMARGGLMYEATVGGQKFSFEPR